MFYIALSVAICSQLVSLSLNKVIAFAQLYLLEKEHYYLEILYIHSDRLFANSLLRNFALINVQLIRPESTGKNLHNSNQASRKISYFKSDRKLEGFLYLKLCTFLVLTSLTGNGIIFS